MGGLGVTGESVPTEQWSESRLITVKLKRGTSRDRDLIPINSRISLTTPSRSSTSSYYCLFRMASPSMDPRPDFLSPSPLSQLPDSRREDVATAHASKQLNRYQPVDGKDNTADVLKAFLDLLPPAGKANIFEDIDASVSDSALNQMARHLVDGLLRPSEHHH
ncbi:hypothetical protein VTN02DRAFT_2542 [Thermoascus thermophilus]